SSPNYSYNAKILLSCKLRPPSASALLSYPTGRAVRAADFQISTGLFSIINVSWPTAFQTFIAWFGCTQLRCCQPHVYTSSVCRAVCRDQSVVCAVDVGQVCC